MNKLVFKKILNDYLIFLIIALISTSIIVWIFQAVNYLDLIVEGGKNYTTYIKYSLLNLPKIVSKIFPFVIFFSFFYILNKFESDNELIIFWSFGINKIQLVYFFFYFSLILMLIQILLVAFVVPNTLKYSRILMQNSNVNFFEGFIKPKKFNDTIKNLTIFSENKDKNGNLENIFLKKRTGLNSYQITYAKIGKLRIGTNNILELYDGETINNNNDEISKFKFERSDYGLNNLESNVVEYIKLQETPTFVILSCLNRLFEIKINFLNKIRSDIYALNCQSKSLQNIFKELYKRFIIPLYIPVLILLTISLILKSKEDKNFLLMKILVFLSNFFLIIFAESSVKFISGEIAKDFLFLLLPFMLAVMSIFLLSYKFKLKFMSFIKK
jgi:lipopolysaccharide export system permease protein